ncbi:MAG: phosphoribosylformylglycinamidine synthase subunit PurL [bacterium]|nr:phosphoribosylformylglycinamidine synthase subunit PurL [bacterium]
MKRVFQVSKMGDEELKLKLKRLNISLTVDEVRKIVNILGRDPTCTELYIFNGEWSEHCSYKSSKSIIDKYLPTKAPNVIQGPEEDAGIIYLTTINGERYGLVIAHESHNHPSQVLPIEGAATGIGGIVRDVDCMGARVLGVADSLRFGDPAGANKERTKWIANGVVQGIWEYANALGVPNLGGDTYFNDSFDDNCLVNVVAIGVVRERDIVHSRVPEKARYEDYDVILIGKPTDSSGFGGASFASEVLSEKEERRGAVQVHDPFLKNVLSMRKANEEVLKLAREKGVEIGFKDLGGAGLACASSEIGAGSSFGIEIDLERVHVGEKDLLPEVIACAETQERYIMVVPSSFSQDVLRIYNEDWELPEIFEGARATIIGKVRKDTRYILTYKGEIVCNAPIMEIAKGIRYKRKATPIIRDLKEPEFREPKDIGEVLLRLLNSPNISKKEYIYRSYDTEVQGNAVIRPGEADATVIAPLEEEGSNVGIALSTDGNPFYGRISPYWGGATSVAEAMRNVASVGATPSCLTDCLNYGSPEKEEVFWEFIEGVRGLSDAARHLWLKGTNTPTPVVSGNVSFYNESESGRAIDPSPIICCIGILEDYSRAITQRFKEIGSRIYLVGERKDELGGSEYYRVILQTLGKNVPKVDFERERGAIYGVIDAINEGLIKACHDISNGGMIITIAEMMISGRSSGDLGVELYLDKVPGGLRGDKKLFTESSGFILEVSPIHSSKVCHIFADYGVKADYIGKVIKNPYLKVKDNGREILNISSVDLKNAWTSGTQDAMR